MALERKWKRLIRKMMKAKDLSDETMDAIGADDALAIQMATEFARERYALISSVKSDEQGKINRATSALSGATTEETALLDLGVDLNPTTE